MAIIVGTGSNDTVNGTNQSDIIITGNGNDTVNAGGGNDIVTGGNGNDVINGDAGNDIIDGANGNDTINGGAGSDILSGGNGNDTIDGGSGSDIVLGGNGNDTLIYRASDNVNGCDIYDGGSGQDTLRLIVTQALASSSAFQAEIAALRAKLAHGSTSFSFNTIDLIVTSIEKLELIIEGPTNRAPTVASAIMDQSVAEDTAWSFAVPAGTFVDPDGNTLTYTATLGTGAVLPSWLTFNATTRTFTGTPPANFNGSLDIKVTASDGSLSASDTFTLTINPVNDAPIVATPIADQTVNEDTAWSFTVPANAFTDVDNATLIYSATLGDGSALPSWLSFSAATRSFAGTPPANFNGSLDIKVTASDGSLSVSDTFTLTVTAMNDAPIVATPIADQVINEDTAWSFTVPAGAFTDVDNASLSYSAALTGGPLPSWLMFNAGTRTFTGTPPANFNGSLDLKVTASDGSLSASDTFTLTIAPVNDAPTTAPVTLAAIAEDSGARLITQAELLANTSDIDSPTLTASNLQKVSGNGTLVDNGDGTWSYTPASNDDTQVTFSYTVTDGSLSAAGSATLDITPANDAPTTAPVTLAAIAEDSGARLITQAELLANASDIDSPTLTASNLQKVSGNGTLVDNGDGTWSYTPASNDDTQVTFSYTVTDGSLTAAGSATLDITPVNDAPVTTPVTLAAIAEDSGARLITQAELLANASDIDSPTLTASNLQKVSGNGTLIDNGDGTWTYTPASNDDTQATFGYTVTDGSLTAAGTATLDITPVNDAPVINTAGATVPNNNAQLYLNDFDTGLGTLADQNDTSWLNSLPVDHASPHALVQSGPTGGVSQHGLSAAAGMFGASVSDFLAINGASTSGGSFAVDFTADAGATVSFDWQFNAGDASGNNDYAFYVLDGHVHWLADQVSVGGYSHDTPWQTLTESIATSGQHRLGFGVINVNTYTDQSYLRIDNILATGTQQVPVGASGVTTQEDGSITISGIAVSDADAGSDSIQVTLSVAHGALALGSTTNLTVSGIGSGAVTLTGSQADIDSALASGVTYTPTSNFNGSDALAISASDLGHNGAGGAQSSTQTINLTVAPVNDAPTNAPVALTAIAEDSGARLITQAELLASAGDIDSQALTATNLQKASGNGTLIDNGDGTWTYTPAANDDTSVSFSYTVTDGSLSAAGSAMLDITPVNDAPTVATAIADQNVAEDTAWTYIVPAGTFADVDNETLTYSATLGNDDALPSWLSFDTQARTFTGTPPLNFFGPIDLKVTASDGSLSASDTFTLNVTPVNDAPVTDAASASGDEDTVIAVTLSASDVDGTIASFRITGLPAHGTLYSDAGLTQQVALNATVTATTLYFKPEADWSGTTTLQYAAIDNEGLQDATSATATIDVAGVADTPVLNVSTDGGFRSAGNFSVSNPFITSIGDFNGDGKADLVVSNHYPGGNTVSIMLGDGAGHFGAPTAFSVGVSPSSSAIGDLNGDGKLDVAVVNQDSASVSILLGNGDGTLQPQSTLSAQNPTSVAMADLNEDGKLDLVVGMSIGNAAKIFLGNGDGTFQSPTSVASGNQIGEVAIGDLNGDGHLDLVAARHGNPPQALVMLGNGNGGFGAPTSVSLDSTGTAVSLTLSDLNGDGKLDLVAANTSAAGVAVALGDGLGGFGPVAHYGNVLPPNNTHTVVVKDFNGDGKADIAVANPAADAVSLMLGNGDGTFQPEILLPTGDLPVSVASADLNGDGRPDLVVSTYGEVGQQDSVTVLLANAAIIGTTDAPIPLNIAASLTDLSETLVVEIDGVPSSYTLSAGAPTDDGGWLVHFDDLAGLELVPTAGVAKPGTLTLHITATSVDGGSSTSVQTDVSVQVNPGATQMAGRVVDGYIAGATVFADADGDGMLGAGEAFTTTAADGTFVLTGGTGQIVMFGGTDISTGLSFNGVMKAPEGSSVVTPLTTLVAALVSTAGSVEQAQAQVLAAFNITLPPDTDLGNYDPVPGAISGTDPAATAVLSAAIQVQSTVSQVAAVGGSQDTVFTAIAGAITAASGNATPAIDLANTTTVTSIAGGSGVPLEAISTVVDVVSAAVGSIQTASNVTELAQAATVAQGAATTALAAVDFQDAQAVGALTQTYVADITTTVSSAEIGIVSLPIIGTIGNDTLNGDAGGNVIDDAIDGLDGDDTINGAGGKDAIYGGAGRDQITGGAGDDTIDGGEGFDRAIYSGATGGITVQLAAGTVTGDASVGSDTLRGIEAITGTDQGDNYNAQNFTATSTNGGGLGIFIGGGNGAQGGFNEFEGKGGDDTIAGNNNTRISYVSATSSVSVTFTSFANGGATGHADGDVSVGNDTFTGIGSVRGSNYDDTMVGSANGNATVETFEGWSGNDFIDGNGGFDRVRYDNQNTGALGIQVNLAAGIITGRDGTATAVVGTDTIRSIESVRGTNAADIFNATGFTTNATVANPNAGTDQGSFNEFEGMGGDDQITGNGNTRISYVNATAAVQVVITSYASGAAGGTGTVDGNGSVGHDTFTGVAQVRGSSFNDTFTGSNNASGTTESFEGLTGDDYIDGGLGFDRARYDVNSTLNSGIPLATGVTINMAAGTVTGRDAYTASLYGNDTLRSIEQVFGTSSDDVYIATNFGAGGANNIGSNGTFNSFQGMGGNDVITGNGSTQILYGNALAGVTVNMVSGTAVSTGANDAAGIGSDTFTGVNNVQGSNFGDLITGSNGNDTIGGNGGGDNIDGGGGNDFITGGAGNDQINGGGGADVAVYAGAYTGTTPGYVYDALAGTVTDNRTPAANITLEGTDTLNGVELLQFSNGFYLVAAGNPGSSVNISSLNLPNANAITSLTNTDDYLTIGSMFGRTINLGAGTDTLNLSATNNSLTVIGVENLVGTGGEDFLSLTGNVTGLSIDLGAGSSDQVNFVGSSNSVTLTNVEKAFSTDFGTGVDDTLTIQNNVSGLEVNLGFGTNTLNLASGPNQFTSISNVKNINAGPLNSTLEITGSVFNPDNNAIFNFGGGIDTLGIGGNFATFSLNGAEFLTGSAIDNSIVINNMVTGLDVDLGGGGNDVLALASGSNSVSLHNVETVQINDFASPTDDTLTILNDADGVSVNLGGGTNTLNVEGTTNTFTSLFGVNAVVGTGQSQSVTVTGFSGSTAFDLGGGLDSLTFGTTAFGVTVTNIENVTGSSGGDIIYLGNSINETTITGGLGADSITASAGADKFRYTSVADSAFGTPDRDSISGLDAASDKIMLDGIVTAAGPFHFIGNAAFSGHGEARLDDFNNLQIDLNGDGTADLEIMLNGSPGTLTDANFQVVAGVNMAPTDIMLSNASVAENSPVNTVVGALTALDSTPGDIATFSIVSDPDGKFQIVGSELRLVAPLDFETKSSHQVTISVTDSANNTYDETFSIGVSDVNESPSVALTNLVTSTPENGGSVKVADIVVTDDALGPNTVSLTGADADAFSISNGSLYFNGGANYEVKAQYDVTVEVNDPTLVGAPDASQNFSLTITDVNEAPSLALASPVTSTPENGGSVKVADIAVTDDALGTNGLSLTGTDAGSFSIIGDALYFNGPADFETKASYSVRVNVDDASIGGTPDAFQDFTLAISNVNETPTDISLSAASIAENSPNGTVVGALSGTDPDAGSTLTFTLVDNAGGRFAISGNNLVVSGALDYETATSHQVTVQVSDGTLTYDEPFTIQVTDLAVETIFGTTGDDVGLVGSAGNDTFDGLAGVDRVLENDATGDLTINMQNGTVSGAGVGSDTLTSIEMVRGGVGNDIYNAASFGTTGANIGSVGYNNADGRFNEFEGMGGNDTITGNGATRISYLNATSGVTVTMSTTVSGSGTATGTATGTDTFSGVNSVRGSDFVDTISGSNNASGVENFEGRGGADTINGLGGFDRAVYSAEGSSNGTLGLTFDLKTGSVAALSGTDTLLSIEGIRGTNFNDTFVATGFVTSGANGPNFGSAGADGNGNAFNEFEGMGGNDLITGNGNTRIAYYNATSGVTISATGLTTPGTPANGMSGTVTGDASVGTDTFSRVSQISGSYFNDTYNGFANGTTFAELFEGREGNDTMFGNGGFDIAAYNNAVGTTGISVTVAAGGLIWNVTGATVGTDSLTGVESIRGTNNADTFNATGNGGFAGTDSDTTLAASFNEFEGFGGSDTITGNGNTRISFINSSAGVNVNLVTGSATGTATGTDTFTGVSRVRGSNFNDTIVSSSNGSTSGTPEFLEGRNGSDTVSYAAVTGPVQVLLGTIGSAQNTLGGGWDQFVDAFENVIGTSAGDTLTGNNLNNILTGGIGSDILSGGSGAEVDIAAYSGASSAYTYSASSVSGGTDGGDSLTNIEMLQFSDGFFMLNSGATYDISGMGVPTTNTIFGLGGDETLTIGNNIGTRTINLAGGTGDVVNLSAAGGYTIGLVNVETVNGTGGNESINLTNNVSGVTFNLGGGTDNINLASGGGSLGVIGVENIFSTDFTGLASDDTLTLLNAVSGVNIALGQGTNTVNLSGGTNAFTGLSGVKFLNGSAGDDNVSLANGIFNADNNPVINLSGGGNDVLSIGSQFAAMTLQGVEQLIGNAQDNFFTLNTQVTGITVDLVSGNNDTLVVANGANSLAALNIDQINGSDFGGDSNDTLTLTNNVTGLSVNLAGGTNTLYLASGANTLVNLNDVHTVHGTSDGDTLSITGSIFSNATTMIDLAGGTDSVSFGTSVFSATVTNVEAVTGSSGSDTITIGNASGTTTITGGLGNDYLTASAGIDHFNFTSVADSAVGNGNRDVVTNFDVNADRFDFSGIAGLAEQINFVSDFTGGSHAEARLAAIEGIQVVQIDYDGNQIVDMEIQVVNLNGQLTNGHFLVV